MFPVWASLYFAWISSPVTFAIISVTIGEIFERSGMHKLIHPQPSVLRELQKCAAAALFIPQ